MRVTKATERMMARHADEARRAVRGGWPVNSKDALLRRLADDVDRLLADRYLPSAADPATMEPEREVPAGDGAKR